MFGSTVCHMLTNGHSISNLFLQSAQDAVPFNYDNKANNVGSGASEQRRVAQTSARHSKLRPSSGSVASQRISGGNRDHSITQFALMDDENISAMQQVTRYAGAITLASQWKSQFDDSESTDNEWKEPQSPDHHHHHRDKSYLASQSHHHPPPQVAAVPPPPPPPPETPGKTEYFLI